MIKQIADGKASLPHDPTKRAVYEAQLQRYEDQQERKAARRKAAKFMAAGRGSTGRGSRTEGRDLAVTTDFRLVLSEVVSRYLGNKDLKTVFPGFEGQPAQFVKLLG